MSADHQPRPAVQAVRWWSSLPGWHQEIVGWWAILVLPIVWWEEIGSLALAFPLATLGMLVAALHWFAWRSIFGEPPQTSEEYYAKLLMPSQRARSFFGFHSLRDWALLLVTVAILLGLSDLLDQAGEVAFAYLFETGLPRPMMSGKSFVGWFIVIVLSFPIWAAIELYLIGKMLAPIKRRFEFAIEISPFDPEILPKCAELCAKATTKDQAAETSISHEEGVLRISEAFPEGDRRIHRYELCGRTIFASCNLETHVLVDKIAFRLGGDRRQAVKLAVEEVRRFERLSDAEFKLISAAPARFQP